MVLTSPSHTRWNSGPLIILGSLVIVTLALSRTTRSRDRMPWLFLYAGMGLWSIIVFIKWVLSERGVVALLIFVDDVIPLQFILWLMACLGMLVFIWRAINLRSRGIWIYLGLHLGLLLVTIRYLDANGLLSQCIGAYKMLSSLPCRLYDATGVVGLFVFAIVLLLLPTVLAFYHKVLHGNISVIYMRGVQPPRKTRP